MRRLYTPKNFRAESKELLSLCGDIIEEYEAEGLRLTLRQLYYRLVSTNVIPNEEGSYKKLGKLVSDGRLAGYLSWDGIEDRVRRPQSPPEFGSLKELMEAAINTYRLPRLKDQRTYVELWVEKDALAGVLWPIARRYHVTLMVNRGYSSQSAMHEAAKRIDAACRENGADVTRDAVILYLGDLDPSGEDMVRDIRERLQLFLAGGADVEHAIAEDGDVLVRSPSGVELRSEAERFAMPTNFEVRKVALTMEQVEEHDPPPNPTKISDSRAGFFIDKYGYESWELDALPPAVLREIVEEELESFITMSYVKRVIQQEEKDVAKLRRLLEGKL